MLPKLFSRGKLLFAAVLVMLLVCLPLTVSAVTDEGDANGVCPAYSFTTMDGTTVTKTDNLGKTTLMIFFVSTDGNSAGNIKELAGADWIANNDLEIVAVDFYEASAAELKAFAKNYGNDGKDITFCSTSNAALWYFLNAAGYSQNSIAIPVSLVIDEEGIIRHYMTGRVSEQSYREALVGYVDGLTMPKKAAISITGTYDYSEAFDVLELVNAERKANGLNPLTMNTTLLEAAMQRAAECSVYFSHTRPNGTSCSTIVPFDYFGENIAAGYDSAAAAVEGWMNSPGHRANILNGNFDAMGVGAFYQDGIIYWVQLFSRDCSTGTASEKADRQCSVSFDMLDSYLNLSVSPGTLSVKQGESQSLAVYVQNTEFYNAQVRLDPSCLTFTSGNTAVASVNAQGTVTGTGGGSTTVKAVPSGSAKSVSVSVSVTATSLATPAISKVENTSSGVKITWGKVAGAAKYKVFIKNTSGSGWTGIGTTSGTTFTYTGAKSGTKYTFTVRCISEDGKTYTSSYNSTGKSITYIAQPSVTKLESTASGVKITWGKVTGAARYRVYVKNSNGNWVNIGNTTGTSFTYTGAKSGTKYTFTVRCVNAANTAFTSSHNSAGWSTTYIAQPKVTKLENTASGVKLTWGKVTGAARYRVYVKNSNGNWVNIGNTTGTSFTYTGAKSGTKYTFTVRCVNAANTAFTSSHSSTGWSTTYIAQPTVTKLQSTSSGVKITWGAVPGAERYRVYVKNSNGNWVNIGTTTGNTFTYTGAKSGTKYTFTVRCVNAANTAFTSSFSATGWSITYTG